MPWALFSTPAPTCSASRPASTWSASGSACSSPTSSSCSGSAGATPPRSSARADPRDAVAGGQFMLVRRSAYEAAGGHAAVRAEVVEDLALGQRIVAAGGRLYLAIAEELIETRMYRSLAAIVEGWSKNLAAGSRLAVGPALRPLVPWLLAAFVFALWLLPPLMFIPVLFGVGGTGLLRWAAGASAAGLFFWIVVRARYRAHPFFSVLYPLGAAIIGVLLLRSAGRGAHFSWKGRAYGPDLGRGTHTREA